MHSGYLDPLAHLPHFILGWHVTVREGTLLVLDITDANYVQLVAVFIICSAPSNVPLHIKDPPWQLGPLTVFGTFEAQALFMRLITGASIDGIFVNCGVSYSCRLPKPLCQWACFSHESLENRKVGNLINYLSDFLGSYFWIPQLLVAPASGISSDLPAPGPGFITPVITPGIFLDTPISLIIDAP